MYNHHKPSDVSSCNENNERNVFKNETAFNDNVYTYSEHMNEGNSTQEKIPSPETIQTKGKKYNGCCDGSLEIVEGEKSKLLTTNEESLAQGNRKVVHDRQKYRGNQESCAVDSGIVEGVQKTTSKDESSKRYLPSPPTIKKIPQIVRRPDSRSDMGSDGVKDKRVQPPSVGSYPVVLCGRERRSSSFTGRAESPREPLQNKARDRLEMENGFQMLKPKILRPHSPVSCDVPFSKHYEIRVKIKHCGRESTGQIQEHNKGKRSFSPVVGKHHSVATLRNGISDHSSYTQCNKRPLSTPSSQKVVLPTIVQKELPKLSRQSSLPLASKATQSTIATACQTTFADPIKLKQDAWLPIPKVVPNLARILKRPEHVRRHSSPDVILKLSSQSLPPIEVKDQERMLQHLQELSALYLQPKKDKLSERLNKVTPKPYGLPPLDIQGELKPMDLKFPDSPALQPTPERFFLPPIEGKATNGSEGKSLYQKLSQPNCSSEISMTDEDTGKHRRHLKPPSRSDMLPNAEQFVSLSYAERKEHFPGEASQVASNEMRGRQLMDKGTKSSPHGSTKHEIILPPIEGRRRNICISTPPEPSDTQLDRSQKPFALPPLEGRPNLKQGVELPISEVSTPQSAPRKFTLPSLEAKADKSHSPIKVASHPNSPVRNLSPMACQSEGSRHRRHLTSPPTPDFMSKAEGICFLTEKKKETHSVEDLKEKRFSRRQESPLATSEPREKNLWIRGSKTNSPKTRSPNKIILPPIEGQVSPRTSRPSSPMNDQRKSHMQSPKARQREGSRPLKHVMSPPALEFLSKAEKFVFPIEKKKETFSVELDLKEKCFSRQGSPLANSESRERKLSRQRSKNTSPQTPSNKIFLPPIEGQVSARNSRPSSPMNELQMTRNLSPKASQREGSRLHRHIASPPALDFLSEKTEAFSVEDFEGKRFCWQESQLANTEKKLSRPGSKNNSPKASPNKIILPPIESQISPRTSRPSSPINETQMIPRKVEGKEERRSPKRRKKRTLLKRLLVPLDTGKAMQSGLSPEPQTPGCRSRFMNFPLPVPVKNEHRNQNWDNLMAENPHLVVITSPFTTEGAQARSRFTFPDTENESSVCVSESTPTPGVSPTSPDPLNIDWRKEKIFSPKRSPPDAGSSKTGFSPVGKAKNYIPSPPKSPKTPWRRTSLITKGKVDSGKQERNSPIPTIQSFLLPSLPSISLRNFSHSKEETEVKSEQELSTGIRTPRIRSPRNLLSPLRLDSRSDYPVNQSFTPPSPALDPKFFGFNIPSPAGSVDTEIEALLCSARRKLENFINNQSSPSHSHNLSRCSSPDSNYLYSDGFLTPSPGRSPVLELEEEEELCSPCHFRSLSLEEKLGNEDNEETLMENYEGQNFDTACAKPESTRRPMSPSILYKAKTGQRRANSNCKESGMKSPSGYAAYESNDRLSPRSCMELRPSTPRGNGTESKMKTRKTSQGDRQRRRTTNEVHAEENGRRKVSQDRDHRLTE